jgi:hypothetical protein
VVEDVSEAFNFLASPLSFPENKTSHAIKIPLRTERKITIASDASNFQRRKKLPQEKHSALKRLSQLQ